jgi:hypothetical protein
MIHKPQFQDTLRLGFVALSLLDYREAFCRMSVDITGFHFKVIMIDIRSVQWGTLKSNEYERLTMNSACNLLSNATLKLNLQIAEISRIVNLFLLKIL